MSASTGGSCAKASREAPSLGPGALLGAAGRKKRNTLMVRELLPCEVLAGQQMGYAAAEKLVFIPVISR